MADTPKSLSSCSSEIFLSESSNSVDALLQEQDIIIDELLNNFYSNREFFDFGTSTAKTEIGFNESLMQQKELFGARAVVKDVYELVCN